MRTQSKPKPLAAQGDSKSRIFCARKRLSIKRFYAKLTSINYSNISYGNISYSNKVPTKALVLKRTLA